MTRFGAVSERILIVKIAALGDAIMASAMIPAIRQEWPTATIGWVAGRAIAPIVGLFDGVDETITINEADLLRGGRLKALRAMGSAWRAIGRRWDRAIIAHTDKRYSLISKFSGAQQTVRYADALAPRRGHWHGSEYVRLVNALTGRFGDPRPSDANNEIRYTPFRRQSLPLLPAAIGDGPLIVIVPGGARNVLRDDNLRRWPLDSWVDATTELISRGYRVVAVGGNSDREECARVAAVGAVNLCGQTSLTELAALLEHADVVVTHDSGPLHLSLALERPVVALFGPTPPAEFLPVNSNTIVLTRAHELSCAPCYDGKNFADCALNLCLQRVPAFEVVDAVEQLLGASRSSNIVRTSK